jgi:Na+/H+ antiporter NhaD/arsenite permease-like protein
MDPLVVGVFVVVYLGMMLGELPGLKLDRTGIALLGAITLVATGRMSLDDAWSRAPVVNSCANFCPLAAPVMPSTVPCGISKPSVRVKASGN